MDNQLEWFEIWWLGAELNRRFNSVNSATVVKTVKSEFRIV
jgi:hypothetical protein